jgi:hypothetical protein
MSRAPYGWVSGNLPGQRLPSAGPRRTSPAQLAFEIACCALSSRPFLLFFSSSSAAPPLLLLLLLPPVVLALPFAYLLYLCFYLLWY